MPHAKMSSPPVFFKKVRRRSSLFYSQSADDIVSESVDPSSPDAVARRDHDPVLPVCSKCRTTALLSESSSAVVTSAPNSPDVVGTSPDLGDHARHRRKSSHREPFVGSYEESLLSRRVAAVSCSPPVQFHVRIGVLGKGRYTGHCPPHISTSVDAVFYDWKNSVFDVSTPIKSSPSNSSSPSEDAERSSPYVGTIDLDDVYKSRSRKFPGYRIPRQGQIQIILSNLQKTAVHFFLIPYDLRKMPPGTKTFIRQKIYQPQPKKLIHAIHLQIACPNKNRLYLYGDVRLVFQNREVMSTADPIPKTKAETISGEYAKFVANSTASSLATDRELCSGCSNIIQDEEKTEVVKTIQPSRPNIARIASREELENQMMEDINASFKLI